MFPGRLFVVTAVREILRLEAARLHFRETGGILLGYRTDENDLVITEATGPGPQARHGWRSFEPDTRYCQERLNATYRQTGGAIGYLGEWHTHPFGSTRPSRLDLQAMLDIAREPDPRLREPALWIYRPAGRYLRWRRPEEHAVWIVDAATVSWQASSIFWLDEIPD